MRIASPERGFRLAHAACGGAPGRCPALEVIYEITSNDTLFTFKYKYFFDIVKALAVFCIPAYF
jgi:hypothetical protein